MLRRSAVQLAAVVTAVVGLSLVAAVPASATEEERGRWVPYPTTSPIAGPSTWHCSRNIPVETQVLVQVCAIRSADQQSAQGAVIVRNNRSGLYGAAVALMLEGDEGPIDIRWTCPQSGVAAGTWSVCFGAWVNSPYPSWVRTVNPGVNGQPLANSGSV